MEPHTGHLYGRDYLKDIQGAHMKKLAEKYDTDIMVSADRHQLPCSVPYIAP